MRIRVIKTKTIPSKFRVSVGDILEVVEELSPLHRFEPSIMVKTIDGAIIPLWSDEYDYDVIEV